MPNEGTESQFEATTIDRLLALAGYRYQYGGEIERDLRDVVMSDWLRGFLQKKYPHLPGGRVEEAIAKASRPEGVTPEQRNKNFHALFTRGFEQKYRKTDGMEAIEHIYVVDWEKPAANDFCVVNQLAIRGAERSAAGHHHLPERISDRAVRAKKSVRGTAEHARRIQPGAALQGWYFAVIRFQRARCRFGWRHGRARG